MTRILEKKRVFIIEDDPMNLAVFSTNLRGHGASILQEAFAYGIVEKIVQSLPIDLILLDIMLKRGLNGYDIYDLIRAEPELQNIPVVAVTSLDPETEIPKAKEKGFNGFISKPINSIKFPKQLAAIINGENLWIISRSR